MLTLFVLSVIVTVYGEDVCPEERKQDCGFYGINEEICVKERGCCWQASSASGVPWCFYHVNSEPSCKPNSERVDCGYVGITEKDCIDKGCCYEEGEKGENIPWCFFKSEVASKDECNANRGGRVDCGYSGIDEEECTGKGCCWNTEVENVPWCYRRFSTLP